MYNKYLKYKKKYIEFKQHAGVFNVLNCSSEYYLTNLKGTCWALSILMILFFSESTRNEFQINLDKTSVKDLIANFEFENFDPFINHSIPKLEILINFWVFF